MTHGGRAASEMFLARALTSRRQQQAAPSPARDSSSLSRRPSLFFFFLPSQTSPPEIKKKKSVWCQTPSNVHKDAGNSTAASHQRASFLFSPFLFSHSRRKEKKRENHSIHREKYVGNYYIEWIGHPSPEGCQSFSGKGKKKITLCLCKGPKHHLPNWTLSPTLSLFLSTRLFKKKKIFLCDIKVQ